MDLNWESMQSHVLLNPRMDDTLQKLWQQSLPLTADYAGHLWLLTSGTSACANRYKAVALAKHAFLTSAAAVNRHLLSDHTDVWLNSLPLFHVGGLGVLARGYLSGARVYTTKEWNPDQFYDQLLMCRGTLTALVPTQLYDLVHRGFIAPQHLRAVIIGGDRLPDVLAKRARALKWPLLASYGMTEACSQVATASLNSEARDLTILDHLKVKTDVNGFICLKGPSLLTSYAYLDKRTISLQNPKINQWFTTEDKGVFYKPYLKILGRDRDFIKINGEAVNIFQLEQLFESIKEKNGVNLNTALIPKANERSGHALHLFVEGAITPSLEACVNIYHQNVQPFEKIHQIHTTISFPKTILGKLIKSKI